MEREVIAALEYANSSNELENNALSELELNKIKEDIEAGRTDESFLYSVVKLVKEYSSERGATEDNVKVRK